MPGELLDKDFKAQQAEAVATSGPTNLARNDAYRRKEPIS